jgi:ABC-type amino acid transport system permease subunit
MKKVFSEIISGFIIAFWFVFMSYVLSLAVSTFLQINFSFIRSISLVIIILYIKFLWNFKYNN